jgi:hypothetical protein
MTVSVREKGCKIWLELVGARRLASAVCCHSAGNGGNIVIHTFLIVTSISQVIFLCLCFGLLQKICANGFSTMVDNADA